jgi:hypothetical protein
VIGLQRDVDEVGRVGDAGRGVERGLRIRRLPRHVPERLRVANPYQRRRPDDGVGRRFRHCGELALIVDPAERERAVVSRAARRGGYRHQPIAQLATKGLVLIGPGEPGQFLDALQPLQRGPPHPHVFVGAGELREGLLVFGVVGQLGDGRGTDGRVGMFPPGLQLEAVEEGHGESIRCFLV